MGQSRHVASTELTFIVILPRQWMSAESDIACLRIPTLKPGLRAADRMTASRSRQQVDGRRQAPHAVGGDDDGTVAVGMNDVVGFDDHAEHVHLASDLSQVYPGMAWPDLAAEQLQVAQTTSVERVHDVQRRDRLCAGVLLHRPHGHAGLQLAQRAGQRTQGRACTRRRSGRRRTRACETAPSAGCPRRSARR